MGLFDCAQPGVFTCDDEGLRALLTFDRSVSSVNSAGEVTLSYASHITLNVDLQPTGGLYKRNIHGIIVEVDYIATFEGNADLQEGDRATISAFQVEVVRLDHYGKIQTEIFMKQVR